MKLYIISEMLNKFLTKLSTLALMSIPAYISIYLLVNHLQSGNAVHGGLWMLLVFNVAYQLIMFWWFFLESPKSSTELKEFFLFVFYIQFFISWFNIIKSFLISEYKKISKEVEKLEN